jgi:hypothetical protein
LTRRQKHKHKHKDKHRRNFPGREGTRTRTRGSSNRTESPIQCYPRPIARTNEGAEQRSEIRDQGSGIGDRGSEMRDPRRATYPTSPKNPKTLLFRTAAHAAARDG